MTAWAETWAPTPREKLTNNALPELESSWDWTQGHRLFLFLLVSDIFSQAAAGNGISGQLWQPGGRKSIVLCSGSSWEMSSCLPAQPTAPLHACTSLLFWWADDWQLPFTASVSQEQSSRSACSSGRRCCPNWVQSVSLCQCVCPQRKQQAVIRSWAIWMGGEVGCKF